MGPSTIKQRLKPLKKYKIEYYLEALKNPSHPIPESTKRRSETEIHKLCVF